MRRSLDDKLAMIVGSAWQTAGQIQRVCGGEAHETARWKDFGERDVLNGKLRNRNRCEALRRRR